MHLSSSGVNSLAVNTWMLPNRLGQSFCLSSSLAAIETAAVDVFGNASYRTHAESEWLD